MNSLRFLEALRSVKNVQVTRQNCRLQLATWPRCCPATDGNKKLTAALLEADVAMGVMTGPLSPVNPKTGKTVSIKAVDCMLAGNGVSPEQNLGGSVMC